MSNMSNQSKIISALESLVKKKRIVFWYDENGEMEETVKGLSLPGIQVLQLDRNPLSVKYRILKEEMPEKGYIVYCKDSRPEDDSNWLLDLETEGAIFSADTVSLYASECGIAPELRHKVVEPHINFFKDAKNRERLASALQPGMDAPAILKEMISVTVDGEPDYDRVLMQLAKEALEQEWPITDKLKEYSLLPLIWRDIEWNFNYKGEKEIKDLLVTLFMDDMARHNSGGKLSNAAHIFMRDWRDNRKYGALYEEWARRLEEELEIIKLIRNRPLKELIEIETFLCIDKVIAVQLQEEVINETMSVDQVEEIVRKREHKAFAKEARNSLRALLESRKLTESIKRLMPGLHINTPDEGFQTYVKELYKIDRHYRDFIRAAKASEGKRMIVPLLDKIQPLYTNSFLDELARKWQPIVDGMEKWRFDNIPSQREFYSRHVAPLLEKNKKVFVIISDALRYETGVELTERIGSVERAVATMLPPMVSTLPSYTQLGMAALLPHSKLSYDKPTKDEVFADGATTQGTQARDSILKKKVPKSLAILEKDFMDITNPKSEFKNYDLIYIYSDKIDFTGDKLKTEGNVFQATEEELNKILDIIRHIRNGNGTNILITSDHGYIYQNESLDESDFSDYKASGDIIADTRRYIIGENLIPDNNVKMWRSEDVGLKPGKEIQIAKGMNRMKKQGSGSRYVHGGAMPQEIVIPVIHVNIKRNATISQTDVDVLNSRARITTNRQTVSFYQTEPVGDNILPSVIKVGYYDEEGNLLSDSPVLTFDCRSSDTNPREQKHTFIFKNELSSLNGKEITLRLERKVRDSEQYVLYKEESYKVSVMFANEF